MDIRCSALLLQRPRVNSKSHDHLACLERHLPLWKDGNILMLLEEGKIMQQRLPSCHGSNSPDPQDTARGFARLMFQGKVKAVLRFISDQSRGSFLPISASVGDSTVLKELVKKHPCPTPATTTSLIATDATNYSSCHPVIFEQLDEHVIRQTSLRLDGAAGLYGFVVHAIKVFLLS